MCIASPRNLGQVHLHPNWIGQDSREQPQPADLDFSGSWPGNNLVICDRLGSSSQLATNDASGSRAHIEARIHTGRLKVLFGATRPMTGSCQRILDEREGTVEPQQVNTTSQSSDNQDHGVRRSEFGTSLGHQFDPVICDGLTEPLTMPGIVLLLEIEFGLMFSPLASVRGWTMCVYS